MDGASWTYIGEIDCEYIDGFWGFTSTEPFTQVLLAAGRGDGSTERFELDNLVYAAVINRPPVANAGPDQTVEQTSPEGADVILDGSGSYDPDGNPLTYNWTWDGDSASGMNPSRTFPLGTTTVTLTVSDGEYTDTDDIDITVQDTTAPVITADLVCIPGGDDDEGLFEVQFSATDNGDPDPKVKAFLKVCRKKVNVTNGQKVEIEIDDDCEIEKDDGRLEIEARKGKISLVVIATDAYGNTTKEIIKPQFCPGDDDDDSDDDSDDSESDSSD